MKKRESTRGLTIGLPVSVLERLKAIAKINGMSVQELVVTSIANYLLGKNEPNPDMPRGVRETADSSPKPYRLQEPALP
jgi:hypothetical protein